MTDDLVVFLRARLDIDEQVAREATVGPWRNAPTSSHYEDAAGPAEGVYAVVSGTGLTYIARTGIRGDRQGMVNAEHIALHDPARVLAEIDAKRRIIAEYEKEARLMASGYESAYTAGGQDARYTVLRFLALPYRDHPDYRPE
jgi:hypothetical protein